jgi:hypothetical protein
MDLPSGLGVFPQPLQPPVYQPVKGNFDFRKTRASYQGTTLEAADKPRKRNRRSLHCAPSDFLLDPVALMKFFRLSTESRISGRG